MPAREVVEVVRQTIAERGTFTFDGFAYPPRARQALALVQSTTGERGAVPIGVTNRRPALIEFLAADEAPPVIAPTGRYSGWFEIGGRRVFLRCTGHRSPTVVFEGGLTTDWFALQNHLSRFTRVCSYDHPNDIDGWDNPHRIQRELGWLSPDEYEAAYHAQLASQPASSTIQSDPMGAR